MPSSKSSSEISWRLFSRIASSLVRNLWSITKLSVEEKTESLPELWVDMKGFLRSDKIIGEGVSTESMVQS